MLSNKSIIKLSVALLFVAATMTGCRSTKPTEGTLYGDGSDTIGDGTILDSTWAEGDLPMDGTRFETLSRVTDAGEFLPVYFDYDAYSIPGGEASKIATVAEFLRINPAIVLVIEGHCDERGTNEYNMSLGEYRGQSVRDQLIGMGVSAARIQTSSFGEEHPANPGHDESAWSRNRRAEFSFYRR